MSSPKEKALELVDKFFNTKKIKLSDYSMIEYPTAKQCALIAVDELIDEVRFFTPNIRKRYYEQVKQEIKKL